MGDNLGKILIISDVHAKIPEMIDFFYKIQEKEKIDFAVHLGDFWSGRNYVPEKGTQVKNEWYDLPYFARLAFPLYHLKGNEDLTQPDFWWNSPNMCLMKNQEPFFLNDWKILPVDYPFRGEQEDQHPLHPEYSKEYYTG